MKSFALQPDALTLYRTLKALEGATRSALIHSSNMSPEKVDSSIQALSNVGLMYQTLIGDTMYYFAGGTSMIGCGAEDMYTASGLLTLTSLRSVSEAECIESFFKYYAHSAESLFNILETHKRQEMLFFTSAHVPGEVTQREVLAIEQTFDLISRHDMNVKLLSPNVPEVVSFFGSRFDFFNWDVRFFPSCEYNGTSFIIVDNYLRILSRDDEVNIVIYNKRTIDDARRIFELAWHNAVPFAEQVKIWNS